MIILNYFGSIVSCVLIQNRNNKNNRVKVSVYFESYHCQVCYNSKLDSKTNFYIFLSRWYILNVIARNEKLCSIWTVGSFETIHHIFNYVLFFWVSHISLTLQLHSPIFESLIILFNLMKMPNRREQKKNSIKIHTR